MAKGQSGFTLLEVLLSVAIIGMLVGLSAPLYASFQSRNDLDITAQRIADALRRAQLYARASTGDSAWSVRVQSGSAVLFKGTTYASRDTNADEPLTIPSSFTVSSSSDAVFYKFTALPAATVSITLTGPATNNTRTITVNAKGMVTY